VGVSTPDFPYLVPRVYLDQPLTPGKVIPLPADLAHYVVGVLRLRAGAGLVLFNGRGGEYEAQVLQIRGRQVEVEIQAFQAVDRESPLPLRLGQGISRGERMDYAIQKAVELGVSAIDPVITQRSVVRLEGERADRRTAHWQGIVAHACAQCGRNRLPRLAPPATLSEWLRREGEPALKIVLDGNASQGLAAVPYGGGPVILLVGPEGGFTAEELVLARASGFRPVSLGPRTLRTETAAVAGLTALQCYWGDLGGDG
jgi:16S rRNA (uracil1498-N3)-methyltransferase